MIAKRLQNFDSSKIRAAFQSAEEMPLPIDLSIGYPEDNTPNYIKGAGMKAILNNDTRYTPSNGIFELRTALAEKLARENKLITNPDRISVTPGVTTGILLTYLAILNPGDEVLISDPYFPPYRDLAQMIDAKPVFVDTFPDFQLTADRIEPLITPKSKAIVVNSPNNPTGAIYPEQELRKIAKLAAKYNLIIISDEIYEYFAYDKPHFSIGSIYPNTITLNGFSKAYAMTGWRVGYIDAPLEIIKAINELQQYVVFSSSSIGQYAALAALRHNPQKLTNKYRVKRNLTKKLLAPLFNVEGCEGAFYAFVPLPHGMKDVEFVEKALQNGVIVLAGSAFSNHQDYIRIAFANDKVVLQKGLDVIAQIAHTLKVPALL